MALGSKQRDYKTSNRNTSVALKWHEERMKELGSEGMDKDKASKQSLSEWYLLSNSEKKKLEKGFKQKYW